MRKYLALTKVLFKSGLGMTSGGRNTGGKNKRQRTGNSSQTILVIVLLVCFLPLIGTLYALGGSLYTMFSQMNLPQLPIELLCYAASITVLIFGLPYVLSVFFLSSDLETLLPMPFKPWEIIGAKFTAVLIYEYLILGFFILPAFVGYGVSASAGPLFWILMIILVLTLPIIPLIYASLLAIFMMRLFKNLKNKELISTIGSFIMVIAIMIISMNVSRIQDTEKIVNAVMANQELLRKMSFIFPNLFFVGDALAGSSILSMLMFLAITAVFLLVFLFIADKIYLGGVMGMKEVTSRQKKMTQAERASYSRQRSPVTAYAWKEFKLLLRTPVYLLNCVLTPTVFPLLIIIPVVISLTSSGLSLNVLVNSVLKVSPGIVNAVLISVSFLLAILSGGSCLVSSTCISREGQGIIFMKYIPMSYRDQLRAKVRNGFLISLAATLPYVLLCLIAGVVFLGASPLLVVLCPALNILVLLLINYLQLWADLTHPKLVWESEQAAVKQNYIATILLFAVWIIGFAIGGGAIVLYLKSGISLMMIALALCVIFCVLAFAVRNALYKYGARKIEDME